MDHVEKTYMELIFEARTLPIWIMCFISLIIIIIVITRGLKKKTSSAVLIDCILLLGLFSFSYPIFLLITGLFPVSEAVIKAGLLELSASLVWSGIRYSLVSITMGLIAMHIAAIGWFFARRFKTK